MFQFFVVMMITDGIVIASYVNESWRKITKWFIFSTFGNVMVNRNIFISHTSNRLAVSSKSSKNYYLNFWSIKSLATSRISKFIFFHSLQWIVVKSCATRWRYNWFIMNFLFIVKIWPFIWRIRSSNFYLIILNLGCFRLLTFRNLYVLT